MNADTGNMPVQESAETTEVQTLSDPRIGRSLSPQEAEEMIRQMEAGAEKAPELELTPENWLAEFGENGMVDTPLGQVKMGENQLVKMFMKGRNAQLGMVKPTLTTPDAIVEVESEANNGQAERPSSLLFIKTFLDKSGEKHTYFTSVTVQRDGMEVAISNHIEGEKRIRKFLEKGKLLYRVYGGAQTEQNRVSVSGTTPPVDPGIVNKGTNSVPSTQEIPRKKDGSPDYDRIDDPATVASAMHEEFGEEAEQVARESLDEAREALEQAGAVKKAIDRRRAQIKARKEVDKWEQVVDALTPTVAENTGVAQGTTENVQDAPEAALAETGREELPESVSRFPRRNGNIALNGREAPEAELSERGKRVVEELENAAGKTIVHRDANGNTCRDRIDGFTPNGNVRLVQTITGPNGETIRQDREYTMFASQVWQMLHNPGVSVEDTVQSKDTAPGEVAPDAVREAATPVEKRRAVSEIVDGMNSTSGADVVVVSTIDELPEDLPVNPGDEIDGVTWKGESYICAPQMQDAEQTRRTYIHEVAGHQALGRHLSNREQLALCEAIIEDIGLEHMRSLGIPELNEEIERYEQTDRTDSRETARAVFKLGREYIAYSTERFFTPDMFGSTTEPAFSVDLSQPITDEIVARIIRASNTPYHGRANVTITGNRNNRTGGSLRSARVAERGDVAGSVRRSGISDLSRQNESGMEASGTAGNVQNGSEVGQTAAGGNKRGTGANTETVSGSNAGRADRNQQGALPAGETLTRKSLTDYILSSGDKPKIDLDRFTAKEGPIGILCENGTMLATDGHSMVCVAAEYPADREGLSIDRPTGKEAGRKFPNPDRAFQNVIKGDVVPLDLNALKELAGSAKKLRTEISAAMLKENAATICINPAEGNRWAVVSAEQAERMAHLMTKVGNLTAVAYERAIVLFGDGAYGIFSTLDREAVMDGDRGTYILLNKDGSIARVNGEPIDGRSIENKRRELEGAKNAGNRTAEKRLERELKNIDVWNRVIGLAKDLREDGAETGNDDIRFRIGDTKTFRSGAKITFTRSNPTVVFNAVKRRLKKEGIDFEADIARTGSKYLSFDKNGVDYKVRFANHTAPNSNLAPNGVSIYSLPNGEIGAVEIDLSESEMVSDDIFALFDEVEAFADSGRTVQDYVQERELPSLSLGDTPFALALDKTVRDMLRNERSRLYKEAYNRVLTEHPIEVFTASNGFTVRDNGSTISVDIPKGWQGKAKKHMADAKTEYLQSDLYRQNTGRYAEAKDAGSRAVEDIDRAYERWQTGNDDIRYRRTRQPQEAANSLIAVHNTTGEQLKKSLELDGFPMPSIAITRAEMGHTGFGEISLLFDRNSIDPSDRHNRVYGGDAWTPTFPQLGVKINPKALEAAREDIRSLLGDELADMYNVVTDLDPFNVEHTLARNNSDILDAFARKEWMKHAYLKSKGEDFVGGWQDLYNKVPTDDQAYRKWVADVFNGLVEKIGIRNDKDMFTPIGNRRKWETLHDEVTLDNVVKAMKKQAAKGGESIFGGDIFGSAQSEYKSLAAIREKAGERLRETTEEEQRQTREAITDRLSSIHIPIQDKGFGAAIDMVSNITEAVKHTHTAKSIHTYLKEIYPDMTMEVAEEIADIVGDIQAMGTRYFEAKPYRAVGFDEVRLAVVPSDTDAELIRQLERRRIPVQTYERGNEEQRRQIVADATEELDIRFRRVYHGSAHDFDLFDHSFMGTGEGVQAFGWGTYVTEVDGIAKSYAEAISGRDFATRINRLAQHVQSRKDFIKVRKADIRRNEDYEKYARTIRKNLRENQKEHKAAERAGDEKDMEFYQSLINIANQQLDPEHHKHLIDSFWNDINDAQADIDQANAEITELKKKLNGLKGNRHLYTVEIPDNTGNNYLQWDEPLPEAIDKAEMTETLLKQVTKGMTDEMEIEMLDRDIHDSFDNAEYGNELYKAISLYVGDRGASGFLSSLGFTGVEYPAQYTIGGREDGAKNYVIFNAEDAKITDHVRFRNMAEANDALLSTEEVNVRFNEELEQQIEGTLPAGHVYRLGMPSEALQAAGISNAPIKLYGNKLLGKIAKHGYTLSDIRNLPEAVAQPIAVFDGSRPGSHAILTELKVENGDNVLVSLSVGKGNDADFNIVSSVYGKNDTSILGWINQGKLRWADKTKALDRLRISAPLAEALNNQGQMSEKAEELSSATNILETFENPSRLEGEKVSAALTLADELGVSVRVVRSTGEIADSESDARRKRGATGWHSRTTGEIAVVLPNCADAAEVQKTILHEAVGHYGIPQLLGRERADELYRRVFAALDEETRDGLLALYGSETVAGDEYLAEMAEGNVTPGVWKRVMAAIRNFFREVMGVDLKMTDADMRYIIWRAKHNLQRARTVGEAMETIEQDIRMRAQTAHESARERKAGQLEKLRHCEPLVFSGDEYKGQYELNSKSAGQYIVDHLRGTYTNADTGETIYVSRKAQKVAHHDAGNNVYLQSVAYIPEMLEQAIFVDEMPNTKTSTGFDSYRYYVCGLKIGEADYTAKIVVGVSDRKLYYDHALTQIEKGDLINQRDLVKAQVYDEKVAKGVTRIPVSEIKDKRLLQILQPEPLAYRQEDAKSEPKSVMEYLDRVAEERAAEENEIRFRRKKQEPGPNDPIRTTKDNFGTKAGIRLQDSTIPVRQMQEWIRKHGGTTGIDTDVHSAMNRASGAATAKIGKLNEEHFIPLGRTVGRIIEATGKDGKQKLDFKQVDTYVAAKSAQERHAAGTAAFSENPLDPWNRDFVDETVEAFESEVPEYLVRELWQQIRTIAQGQLRMAKEYGLLSAQSYRDIVERGWQYYVPLQGIDAEFEGIADAREIFGEILPDRKGESGGQVFHRAMGRTTKPADVLATLQRNVHRTVIMGERNVARQFLLRLAEQNPQLQGDTRPAVGADRQERENEGLDLKTVNEAFNRRLERLTPDNADSTVLWLGSPSAVLRSAGVGDSPIKLHGNKVVKKMKKHGFALEEIRNLPEAVADPIAVFRNKDRQGNRAILTELRTKNGCFLVTIDLGSGPEANLNVVSSVFGKADNSVLNWLEQGYATYINKEKALAFLDNHPAPIAGNAANAELSLVAKVIKNFANPPLPETKKRRAGIFEVEEQWFVRKADNEISPEQREAGEFGRERVFDTLYEDTKLKRRFALEPAGSTTDRSERPLHAAIGDHAPRSVEIAVETAGNDGAVSARIPRNNPAEARIVPIHKLSLFAAEP